jgi:hypothetical protein
MISLHFKEVFPPADPSQLGGKLTNLNSSGPNGDCRKGRTFAVFCNAGGLVKIPMPSWGRPDPGLRLFFSEKRLPQFLNRTNPE